MVIGYFINTRDYLWKFQNQFISICIILFMLFFCMFNNLDPNFASFYIACVIALTDWNKYKYYKSPLFLILVGILVSFVLKSRAFFYATSVFIFFEIFSNFKIKEKYFIYILSAFIFLPAILTYIITINDEGVVRLYTNAINTSDLYYIAPSLYEKIQNLNDVNRFRITRLWLDDFLLVDWRFFVFGLSNIYFEKIKYENLYPIHNSYLEILAIYGFLYLASFMYIFWSSLPNFGKYSHRLFYLLSFGMVIHGIYYLGLIPIYYIIAKIAENYRSE